MWRPMNGLLTYKFKSFQIQPCVRYIERVLFRLTSLNA